MPGLLIVYVLAAAIGGGAILGAVICSYIF